MARFDIRDIRPGMDVSGRDGAWLGTVLRVEHGPAETIPLSSTTYPSSSERFDGEATGPGPTQRIGNSGPLVQSREAGYLGGPSGERAASRLLVGRWYGLLARRWIAVDDVVNVTLECVVVDLN